MSVDNRSLSAALIDVRHAYRLLADYQRRCLDMVTLIGQQFPETQFYNWTSTNGVATAPLARVDPRTFWGWNFLPLYQPSILFVPQDGGRSHPGVGDWLLEVRIVTDTGWELGNGSSEPEASSFKPAEEAKSWLSIIIFKCIEEVPEGHNWFHQVWGNAPWPEETEEADEQGLVSLKSGPLSICQLDAALEDMTSKDAVKAFCERAKRLMSEKLHIEFAAP